MRNEKRILLNSGLMYYMNSFNISLSSRLAFTAGEKILFSDYTL